WSSSSDFTKVNIKSIKFDSIGKIFGFLDTIWIPPYLFRTYEHISGSILFPPNMKNIVNQESQIKYPIKFWIEYHSLITHSENPLGSTTASLYSIDGRL